MAMWADNLKFGKDIIDTKYNKIEVAVAEVTLEAEFLIYCNFLLLQLQESMDTLEKDPACNKSKEHFNCCLKTLEQIQTEDIHILLETIISVRE